MLNSNPTFKQHFQSAPRILPKLILEPSFLPNRISDPPQLPALQRHREGRHSICRQKLVRGHFVISRVLPILTRAIRRPRRAWLVRATEDPGPVGDVHWEGPRAFRRAISGPRWISHWLSGRPIMGLFGLVGPRDFFNGPNIGFVELEQISGRI
ncbi:saccharopine dehydrogenase [NADP+ [Striga asiatica]|uniref:Saccharopine dehydrogenase [NADP n=1 Tax=Striga asiatica TaxID=4170 RepID=A0A5A7QPC2_STRAF|nr:saccharopine dehydrogenase [NADP+ [Striga asiatica]